MAHSHGGLGRKQTSRMADKTGYRSLRKVLQSRYDRGAKPDTASYRTFNDFFVRPLRDDVRPLNTDPNIPVMPADGVISQLGRIEEDKILQAKGHNYSLEALLAGNYLMADKFRNGTFVTTYLSPRDYHRVHMPCNGILREMIYVPGDLFSVNHLTAQNVPNLFARNERVICLFDTEFGPMAQILVGATIVGSIETVWAGTITRRAKASSSAGRPEGEHEGSVALLKGRRWGALNWVPRSSTYLRRGK